MQHFLRTRNTCILLCSACTNQIHLQAVSFACIYSVLPLCHRSVTAADGLPSQLDPQIREWLPCTAPHFDALLRLLADRHSERLRLLQEMAGRASEAIWWPFTQHSSLQEGSVQVRKGNVWLGEI